MAKIADLFFVVYYTSKSKLINTHWVMGTIGEETPVAFAIYSELERTFCKVSIAWQTKSDKAGQLTENVRDTEGSAKCNRRVYYCRSKGYHIVC